MSDYYVNPQFGSDSYSGTSVGAPFATIDQAIATVVNGDTIWLSGGRHVQDARRTVSGLSNLTISGYDGERPVITGAVSLTGTWTLIDAAKQIWRASAQGITSLDLIVNRKRAWLAQIPLTTSGWGNDSTGWSSTGGQGNGFSGSAQFVRFWDTTNHMYNWTESLLPVTSITATRINVDATGKSYYNINSGLGGTANPSHLVNSLKALEQDKHHNRFAIDPSANGGAGYVYYRAQPDEDMTTAESWLSAVDGCLVRFTACTNLTITGVTFADTTCLRPLAAGGFVETQAGYRTSATVPSDEWANWAVLPGMVEIVGGSGASITDCYFHRAGAYGVWIRNGATGWTIDGCQFYGNSAGHVQVGQYTEYNTGNGSGTIKRSYLGWAGQGYPGGSPIVAFFASGVTVDQCEIDHCYYSAFQFIGGWGTGTTVTTGGHTLSKLRIKEHNLTRPYNGNTGGLPDGGGIYTNGRQPGMTIDRCWVSRTQRYADGTPVPIGIAALYFDENTTTIAATNFVVSGDGYSGAGYFKENANNVTAYATVDNIYYPTGLGTIGVTHVTITNTHASADPTADTSGAVTGPAICAAVGLPSGYTHLRVTQLPTPPESFAHWHFQNSTVSGSSVYDTTGNGYTLTLGSGATVTAGAGPNGLATLSGGTATGSPVVTYQGLTYGGMAQHIKAASLPANKLPLYNGSTGGTGCGLYISDGSCGAGSKVAALAGGMSCDREGSTYTLTAGNWSHIRKQREGAAGTTWKTYVNSSLDHTGGTGGCGNPETSAVSICESGLTVADTWITGALNDREADYQYLLGGGAVADVPQHVEATPGTGGNTVTCERPVGATGFKLYRSTDDSSFSQVGGTFTAPTMLDSTAVVGTKYYYGVVVTNSAGSSSRSQSVVGTVQTLDVGSGDGVGMFSRLLGSGLY